MSMSETPIRFPDSVQVTEQDIDVSFLNEKQRRFYIDLFAEVISLYEGAQKPRFVLGIAGPTGSGKSTMVALFDAFAKQSEFSFSLRTLGIDAFHFPEAYLKSHATADGSLKEWKGRFDSYDVPKLVEVLDKFRSGDAVELPTYSRRTHEPVEHAVSVKEKNALLIVEGLWLLYQKSGWETIGPRLDHSIFVEADEEAVRAAVVERHMRGGRTREDAEQYYDRVDKRDFELVNQTISRANKIIPAYYVISGKTLASRL